MAMGNNQPERSRKRDLVTQIRMSRVCRMTMDNVLRSTKGYARKTSEELQKILHAETETKS